VILLVTIDYILIGVVILLAILDVVLGVIHLKPQSNTQSLELLKTTEVNESNDDNMKTTMVDSNVESSSDKEESL